MSKFGILILFIALSTAMFISCASSGHGPNGGLFSSTVTGLSGSGNGKGAKEGKACAHSILGIVGVGGDSVATIASTAGITNIKSVNNQAFSILGLYANLCTVVSGD